MVQKPPAVMPPATVPVVDPDTGLLSQAWYGYFRDLGSFATPIEVVTVAASPFTYTAVHAGNLLIKGGIVGSIGLIRARVTIAVTGLTSGFIPISQDDRVVITYTGLPEVWFIPNGNAV
jgi:hypothetical protein